MNMQDILDLSRNLTYKTSSQVPDDQLIQYSNINYKQLVRKIITDVNEDFFYEEWTTDLVSWQEEYIIPAVSSTNQWAFKLLWIEVKYSDDSQYYKKLTAETIASLGKSLWYYKTEQPTTEPFYRLAENSIFIYPTPTKDVTDWILLYWVKNAIDLETTAVEDDFILPKSYLHLIAYWNMYHIYIANWELEKANVAKQNFFNEVNEMISELNERNLSAEEITLPNLTHLE